MYKIIFQTRQKWVEAIEKIASRYKEVEDGQQMDEAMEIVSQVFFEREILNDYKNG